MKRLRVRELRVPDPCPPRLGEGGEWGYAAAAALAPVGTSAIVFRICDAIW
jgi:hypothetical protein